MALADRDQLPIDSLIASMHLALVSNIFRPHIRGGYEMGCEQIARCLSSRGITTTVLTSRPCGQLSKWAPPEDLSVEYIFEPVFCYEDQSTPASNLFSLRRREAALAGVVASNVLQLATFLKRSTPDFVWVFNPLGLGPVGICETLLTSKIPFCFHFMDDIDGVIGDHQSTQFTLARWSYLKNHSSAISCSQLIRGKNERFGNYRTHTVIPNGVQAISNSSHRQPLQGALRLLYFGQLAEHKGILQTLNAHHALRRLRPDLAAHLYIAGGGDPAFVSRLKERIAALETAKHVTFLGRLEPQALRAEIATSQVAVMLLDRNEPFAYAPLEAAVSGLPVVIPSNTTTYEVLPPTYPLAVQDRSNAEEVAELISRFCDTHPKRVAIANHLSEHIAKHLDLDNAILPRYLNTLKKVGKLPSHTAHFSAQHVADTQYCSDTYASLFRY